MLLIGTEELSRTPLSLVNHSLVSSSSLRIRGCTVPYLSPPEKLSSSNQKIKIKKNNLRNP